MSCLNCYLKVCRCLSDVKGIFWLKNFLLSFRRNSCFPQSKITIPSISATACWMTGGTVDKIEVYGNEGGVTNFRGGFRPCIIPAGYVGVSFWGGMQSDLWYDVPWPRFFLNSHLYLETFDMILQQESLFASVGLGSLRLLPPVCSALLCWFACCKSNLFSFSQIFFALSAVVFLY